MACTLPPTVRSSGRRSLAGVLGAALVLGFGRTEAVLRDSVENRVLDAARMAALDLSDDNEFLFTPSTAS